MEIGPNLLELLKYFGGGIGVLIALMIFFGNPFLRDKVEVKCNCPCKRQAQVQRTRDADPSAP